MSRKVSLVLVRSFLDIPTFKDTFSAVVDIDEPAEFEKDSLHIMGVRLHNAGTMPSTEQHPLDGDYNAIILDSRDFSFLLGRLLTQIDATFSDTDQRKAQKDLLKDIVWGWEKDLRERSVQTVDSHLSK